MFFKKIKNNQGFSALSFIFVLIILIVVVSGLLDFINIVRLKSVMLNQGNELAIAATNQSGFRGSIPQDWKDLYGTNSTNYVTKSKAISSFKEELSYTVANVETAKIELETVSGTYNLATAPGDVIIDWQKKAKLIISVSYEFKYLKAANIFSESLISKNTSDVVGFWVHKSGGL